MESRRRREGLSARAPWRRPEPQSLQVTSGLQGFSVHHLRPFARGPALRPPGPQGDVRLTRSPWLESIGKWGGKPRRSALSYFVLSGSAESCRSLTDPAAAFPRFKAAQILAAQRRLCDESGASILDEAGACCAKSASVRCSVLEKRPGPSGSCRTSSRFCTILRSSESRRACRRVYSGSRTFCAC